LRPELEIEKSWRREYGSLGGTLTTPRATPLSRRACRRRRKKIQRLDIGTAPMPMILEGQRSRQFHRPTSSNAGARNTQAPFTPRRGAGSQPQSRLTLRRHTMRVAAAAYEGVTSAARPPFSDLYANRRRAYRPRPSPRVRKGDRTRGLRHLCAGCAAQYQTPSRTLRKPTKPFRPTICRRRPPFSCAPSDTEPGPLYELIWSATSPADGSAG